MAEEATQEKEAPAPAEKPAEKPAEEPAAAPEEKPAEKPAEKPQGEAAPAEAGQPSGGSSKPFLLSLIGGILIIITGAILAFAGTLITAMIGSFPGAEGAMATLGAISYIPLVFGILVIVGAVLMKNPAKAKIGAILVLIFSILSLLTIVGSGFFIGAILGIIGGALGLKK